ncbi:MAG: putative ATPase [Myxococcota bacterium]
MDLFDRAADQTANANAPLADRLRPATLDDMIGQQHAVGPTTFLAKAIAADRLPSVLLWGPPGVGKTTLGMIVARATRHTFVPFSAVLGGVKEVRVIVAKARERLKLHAVRTVLFVDEIHRFNKAQQDAFLPHVEKGTIVLIGATTENPSFEINAALLSRMRVVRLKPLQPSDLITMLERALATPAPTGLGGFVTADPDALTRIAAWADGDARRALNLLDAAASDAGDHVTVASVDAVGRSGGARYDKSGDQHYDVVSAFIKSLRGSDPDAALYYLARMLEAGENPRFIMRRLVIFAAEDVGNADPRGLQVATAAAQGFETVGMPEGQLLMAQATTFLATAPKSNASYRALKLARATVQETGGLEVPLHIRNAPTGLMASYGYGQGYVYPHDYGGYARVQYLPEAVADRVFYEPTQNGYEARISSWLDSMRGPGAVDTAPADPSPVDSSEPSVGQGDSSTGDE